MNTGSVGFEDDFLIYQNSVKGNTLFVQLQETPEATYRVLNMLGQTLITRRLN